MATTDRHLAIGNEETADGQRSKRAHYHYAFNTLLLIILLSLFVFGFNRVTRYERDVTRSTFVVQGTISTPVLEMYPGHKETPLVAIVAHGFSESKEMMTGFGIELARAGITTYLFDFPGHGQSSVPISNNASSLTTEKDNTIALSEVINYARQHNSATKYPRIILLGHTTGTTAIGEYEMAHSTETDIIATILVSPTWQGQPTSTEPKNMLLLVGQNDIPAELNNSTRLLHASCQSGNNQPLSSGNTCGTIADGTAHRLVILQNLDHITIVDASRTFQEMLDWLHSIDAHISTTNMHADERLTGLLLGVICIILALFPLSDLLVDIFHIQAARRSFRGLEMLFFHICLLIGIAVALAIQYIWQPFSFMHIALADYVSGYFFIIAVVMAVLIFIFRRYVPLPLFSQIPQQLLLATVLAAFLYFTFGQLMTFAWQHFTFTLPRLWRFLAIFILILPLFLLDEGINRGYQETGMLRAIMSSLIFKALLIGGLIVAVQITSGLNFLSIILPLLLLLFLVLVGSCIQLYHSGHAAFTGAIFTAFMIAWCMSMIFPIT
ncbi:MAG TPA: alpha/beta fold hydrolase [Ktedonobacteraceae bacterium]|jgi:pimeloyl-ACP methyl ester carboxylesterase